MPSNQVAVLIDYENTGLGAIQGLLDRLSDIGRLTVKRAYADWSLHRRDRDQLLEFGIEPVHVFRSRGSGKNSADIRLVIDAIELLYQSPVDTFAIVSSDSDFVHLVNRLRAAGKTIIGAGPRATAPRTLVTSCDQYLYLEYLNKPQATKRAPEEATPTPLDSILVRAVKVGMDDQGAIQGSKLRETMQRLDPGFNYRDLGFSNFARFLEASPSVKVTRPPDHGDITVELASTATNSVKATRPPDHGDITVEFASTATNNESSSDPDNWESKIDQHWKKRAGESEKTIPGSTAAFDAARVLGVRKLSLSRYATLQRLLEASSLLGNLWVRDGNKIIRKGSQVQLERFE
jgi:uncharacterized protein (TIGR00288 family)